MPRFSVLVSGLENECSKLNAIKGELLTYASRINSVKSSLPIYGNSAAQIKTALEKSRENVNRLSEKAQLLSDNLSKAGYAYTKVEKSSDGNSDIENEKLFETNKSSDISFIDNTIFQFILPGLIYILREIFNGKQVAAYEVDSIVFDDDGSYGGDQGAAQNLNKRSEERKEIERIIKRNLADSGITDNIDISKYLKKLNSEGCGYVALANTIFVYYQGREESFKKAFGYSMYNSKGDLNYNLLIADVYSSMDNRKNGQYDKYADYNEKKDGDKSKYNPWKDTTGSGSNPNNYQDYLDRFMSDRCVSSKVTQLNSDKITSSDLKEYTENGKSVLLAYYDGNIYKENGHLQQYIDGGHGMIITGITNDGKYIVSSWGEKYIINPDEGKCRLFTIEYSEK